MDYSTSVIKDRYEIMVLINKIDKLREATLLCRSVALSCIKLFQVIDSCTECGFSSNSVHH